MVYICIYGVYMVCIWCIYGVYGVYMVCMVYTWCIYGVYTVIWQGNHLVYGCIQCIYIQFWPTLTIYEPQFPWQHVLAGCWGTKCLRCAYVHLQCLATLEGYNTMHEMSIPYVVCSTFCILQDTACLGWGAVLGRAGGPRHIA